MMLLLAIAALVPPHPLAVVAPPAPQTVAVTLLWDATNVNYIAGFDFSWRTNGGTATTTTLTNYSPSATFGTFQFEATNLPTSVPIQFAVDCFNTNGIHSAPATLTWNQQWFCIVDLLKGDGVTWTNSGTVHSNLVSGPELFLKLNVRKVTR